MNQDFEFALNAELQPDETVVWQAQPNTDALRSSLLSFFILWLSGLFMLGAGILRGSPDEPKVLYGMIAMLVIVSAIGAFELVFVPRRAGRTMYFLTNKRLFTLCVTKRPLNPHDNVYAEKNILSESKNSIGFFFTSNLPSLIFFILLAQNVMLKLLHSFDPFVAVGFCLVLLGSAQPWFHEMRLPLPKFRDTSRIFYSVGDLFVFLESLNLEEIAEFFFRRGRQNTYNAFVVSKDRGCIRLRAIPKAKELQKLLKGAREIKKG